jgi:hypothetical protein
MAKGLVAYLSFPGFDLGLLQVGFVVDNVALGQVFSEYFGLAFLVPFDANTSYSFSHV